MAMQHRIALDLIWLGRAMRQFSGNIDDPTLGGSLTGTQAFIVDYIYTSEQNGIEIFQRDIEQQFNIGRSATSGMLRLMENNGIVTRTSVLRDARLKKMSLTPRYRQHQERIQRLMNEKEEYLNSVLTPEETEQFWHLIEKLSNAISRDGKGTEK